MDAFFHTTFGFCMWDLAALLVLLALVVALIVHIVHAKRREARLEDQLSEKMAIDAMPDALDEDDLL